MLSDEFPIIIHIFHKLPTYFDAPTNLLRAQGCEMLTQRSTNATATTGHTTQTFPATCDTEVDAIAQERWLSPRSCVFLIGEVTWNQRVNLHMCWLRLPIISVFWLLGSYPFLSLPRLVFVYICSVHKCSLYTSRKGVSRHCCFFCPPLVN